MNEIQTNEKKRSRGLFFYVKVLAVFILLILLSVSIGIWYVYHQLGTDGRLEKLIMEKASSTTGIDMKFAGYELSFPRIAINNISIATDSAAMKLEAKIADVRLQPDIWAALNGELLIESLSLSSSTTLLEFKKTAAPDGASAIAGQSPPFDFAAVKLPFNSVDLSDINVIVSQPQQDAQHVKIKKAALSRSLLSSSMPFNVDGEVVALAGIRIDGKLYWPGNVAATVNIDAQNIGALKKFVPVEYHDKIAFIKGAALAVDLKYSFADSKLAVENCQLNMEPGVKADASVTVDSFSPFNGKVQVRVLPVETSILWPIVKEYVPKDLGLQIKSGRIGAAADVVILDSKPDKISVSLTPDSVTLLTKKLADPVSLKKGEVSYADDRVIFSGFSASMADSSVEMSRGTLKVEPLAFAGEFKLSADLGSMYKLASGYLTDEAKAVAPTGKAEFVGKLDYDGKGVKVNGSLESASIGLKEKKSGAQASIEKIKVHFADVGPARGQIKIDSLEVKGAGAAVKVKGNVTNAADMGFDVTADGNLNIDEFSRLAGGLFRLPVKAEQFKGNLGINVRLGGTMSQLKPSGKLVLQNVAADLTDQGLVLANLNGSASADQEKLTIEKLSAELLGGKVDISGTLKDFKKPIIDVKAVVAAANLAKIRDLIRKHVPDMPEEIEFSGSSDLIVSLTGRIDDPKIVGEAVLSSVRFFHPAVLRPIEDISGPISFTNSGLTAKNVSAGWGKSKAVVSGQLRDWAKFVSDFKYTVMPLDITDATDFFLKGSGYSIQGTGSGNGSITGPVEKIKVDGVASAATLLANAPVNEKGEIFKFPAKNVVARFSYSDSVFDVSSADLTLFSGQIKGSGKAFLASNPIRFEYDAKVENLQTQDFLKENTKYPDVVTGGLNGTFTGKGNTQGLATINGNATLSMPKGTYNSPPMVRQIGEQLSAPQLASGTINNVSGDYIINGGRISSKNVVATSNHGKVVFLGSVGLDATIDGDARFQITRQACQSSNILRELVGNDEYLDIPVSVKGSMMSPSIGIPLDRMMKDVAERRAKDALKKEAGKMLDKLLGGGKQAAPATASSTVPAPASEPAPKKKIENQLKDLGKELNKLFKKK